MGLDHTVPHAFLPPCTLLSCIPGGEHLGLRSQLLHSSIRGRAGLGSPQHPSTGGMNRTMLPPCILHLSGPGGKGCVCQCPFVPSQGQTAPPDLRIKRGCSIQTTQHPQLLLWSTKATTRSPGPCQGSVMAQAGLAGPFPSPAQAPSPGLLADWLPLCRAGCFQRCWGAANSMPPAMAPCPGLWHCLTCAWQSCQAPRMGPHLYPTRVAQTLKHSGTLHALQLSWQGADVSFPGRKPSGCP